MNTSQLWPTQPQVLTLQELISARLSRFQGRPCTYFPQRLQLGLHDELVLAQLAAARVRALDPLLQAGLVHEVEAPCAVAGRDQMALVIPFTVTDPTVEGKSSLEGGPHDREDDASVEGQSAQGKCSERNITK